MTDSTLWVPPSANTARYRKEKAPPMGNAFGAWAGRDQLASLRLPGGGVLQFDLDRLTLSDYRAMRSHYQVNISLAALNFLMHQIDWRIECSDKRIAAASEEALRRRWTVLTRATSQAYWAGYSPTVIDWENDQVNSKVTFGNFKDLVPEECRVHWKIVEGYPTATGASRRFLEYDGIDQGAWIGSLMDGSYLDGGMRRKSNVGGTGAIPAESTMWYSLLMENGDYYGRKLLKPAFPAWFFSQLIHLFANRYFERFGEPLPVGRAPFEEVLNMPDGSVKNGRDAMENILAGIRNRAVMVLPNDLQPQQHGSGHTKPVYEYEVEYLESQMRGADFERYLSRLDEEISLALFTPLLMTRVADVGSYNLGVGHMQMYLWMFNALAGDLKQHIDDYPLNSFVDYNFGKNAPRARWEFNRGGKQDPETLRAVVTALITGGAASVDLNELGTALGLSLKEVKQITAPIPEPGGPSPKDSRAGRVRNDPKSSGPRGVGKTRATAKAVNSRIAAQVQKAFRDGTFGPGFRPTLGYRRQFEDALVEEGDGDAAKQAGELYGRVQHWMNEAIEIGPSAWAGPDEFMGAFERVLESEIEPLVA